MAVTINGNNTPTAGGVVYGDGSTYASTTAGSAGSVLYSAGASAPAFTAVGTSGYLLQSNGAAAPSWVVAPTGASAATPTVLGTVYGKQTTSGGTPFLTAIGYNAGLATTGINCTAVGVSALQANTSGENNTASGYRALYTVISGSQNNAFGTQALNANTGSWNDAFGYQALVTNSSGAYNCAFGGQALTTNLTGESNVAMGWRSLYNNTASNNTAVGFEALKANTTQSNNTAVGYQALYSSNQGDSNTAVGYQALYNTLFGVRVTAVGYKAGYSHVSSGSNGENTYVGYLAGTASTGYYNTIIGSNAGNALAAGGNFNTFLGTNAGTYSTPITTGSTNIMIGSAAGASSAAADGQFVIGTTVVSQGNATITIGSPAGKIYNSYGVNATWTQTSDERLKQDINSDTLGLSFINRLRPVTYSWKPSNEIDQSLPQYNEVNQRTTGVVMHGLIAQEVKAALDAEGVSTFAGWDVGSDNVQCISREMFISPLIKAIQELKAEFDAYKASHP